MQAAISQPRIVVYGVLGWEKAMGFGMIWGCQSCYELMGGSAAKWDGPPRCNVLKTTIVTIHIIIVLALYYIICN